MSSVDINQRNFQTDFLAPALKGLSKREAIKMSIALDAAIAFGALEHASGNESLQDLTLVTTKYWDNVARLKGL